MSEKNKSPHIVVLCLDTVRKDYYDQYATRLRNLATIKFEGMRALSSWSVPSHAGMLTGKVPSEAGIHADQRHFDSIDRSETWLKEFSDQGYETLCVSANVYASPIFGFDHFFDEMIPISPSRRFPEGIDIQQFIMERNEEGLKSYLSFFKAVAAHEYSVQSLLNGLFLKIDDLNADLPFKKPFDYGGASITRTLRRSLMQADDPKFVFANIMDAHGPHTPFRGLNGELYDASSSFDSTDFKDWDVTVADELGEYEQEVEMVRQLYSAEIDYLDRILSDLVEKVTDVVERDVVFVVTADHGENLGYKNEDYMMNHVSSLSEALLHVPFDIIAPNYKAQYSINGLASHEDLGKILLSIRKGESLANYERETARAEIVGSGSELPEDEDEEYWNRNQRVVYYDNYKYYCDILGNQSVYEISRKASKSRKLPEESIPEQLFEQHFPDWISENGGSDYTEDVNKSTQSRLEDLGYL